MTLNQVVKIPFPSLNKVNTKPFHPYKDGLIRWYAGYDVTDVDQTILDYSDSGVDAIVAVIAKDLASIRNGQGVFEKGIHLEAVQTGNSHPGDEAAFIQFDPTGGLTEGSSVCWASFYPNHRNDFQMLFTDGDWQGGNRIYTSLYFEDGLVIPGLRLGTSSAYSTPGKKAGSSPNVYQVAHVWGGGTGAVYINGNLIYDDYTFSGTPGQSDQHQSIGIIRYWNTGTYAYGANFTFHDCKIFNRRLSGGEVKYLYDHPYFPDLQYNKTWPLWANQLVSPKNRLVGGVLIK